jgi:general secretion pathway protein K
MTPRGFALLTVLWVLAALSAVVSTTLALARTGAETTHNRLILTRAAWAREACSEILLARYARDASVRMVDTVDLGRGSWCLARLEDAGDRLDLNLASAEALRSVIGEDSLVDALLDWRDPDEAERPFGAEARWYRANGRRLPRNGPLADVRELTLVRGFDSARVAGLQGVLTSSGVDRVSLNAAPPALLATLPGLGPEAVDLVLRRRSVGRWITGGDELLALLSSSARAELLSHYREFIGASSFAPSRFVAQVEGGVRGSHLVCGEILTLIPAAGRLAVARRVAE